MSRTSAFGRTTFIVGAIFLGHSSGLAQECPKDIATATKIVLVTAESIDNFQARVEAFERSTPRDKFHRKLAASPAVIGRNGLAWGWSFRASGDPGEAPKVEGDGRTPAGLYRLGRPFGFERKAIPGYLTLEVGKTFCVDDPRSPHYNQIVARSTVPPGTSGEEMRSVPGYRDGIVVDYASDAAAKAGSCIFVHIWRSSTQGTAGCIAADRKVVVELQRWANDDGARIGVYSRQSAAEVLKCMGL
jgi:L,D-peptidoglycan transpeptidase YkuD (ErfK/YbiS/YcfS/YnhG family)